MFSTLNSAQASDSDEMFTRMSASTTASTTAPTAASTNCSNDAVQNDLIAFLSIVQKCNVDYIPIMWQPCLSALGEGGSGTISQCTFNSDMPLAFKRFHKYEDSEIDFLPMMSEVLILSQPPIQNHPHIVNLEGICWEIKPRTEKAVPVLILEKASWDLKQFMTMHEGINMSVNDRLKICADIGSAIMALHACDVIHGDIKPQNVLVFKDATGTTVKVADFGYSTLAAGESGKVLLPKSRPWNAPEHHFGEFDVFEAKKTDVYSFGLLCLWVLLAHSLPDIPQTTAEGATELISFDASHSPCTVLEQLKNEDKLEAIANQYMETVPMADLNAEQRIHLKQFFSSTITFDPKKRTSDLGRLMVIIRQARFDAEPQSFTSLLRPGISSIPVFLGSIFKTLSSTITRFEAAPNLSTHADFRIAKYVADFMKVDFRVRTQIKDSLEKNHIRNENQPFAAHIAFQLAFCYRIGFGAKSDHNESQKWLERSLRQSDDLKVEMKAVPRRTRYKNPRIRATITLFTSVDLISEYRACGLKKLEEARKVHKREVDDMAREFGALHPIPLDLYTLFGDLLDELGEFQESKEFRMWIRDQIKTKLGVHHPDYAQSVRDVAESHCKLGEWIEAQPLLKEAQKRAEVVHGRQSLVVATIICSQSCTLGKLGRWNEAEERMVKAIKIRERVLGQEHPNTLISKDHLAVIYSNQGRWKEAKELEEQATEISKRVFGQEDTNTLTFMANLATTYSDQGRWKEANELEKQIMETRKRVLGKEHPATLTGMCNLAWICGNQGRWNESEDLGVEAIEISKRVLGQEHPDTLTGMANLASTYRNQGRWKEAQELLVQVMETRKKVLGQEHPSTLIGMCNLAYTYGNQGRWSEAEDLGVESMEIFKKVLGQEHPDTLTGIATLASIYRNQGRWKEAEKLEVQVLETRKRVLSQEHPDTLTGMGNLASTYRNQGRWKEAEELEMQVLEKRKRVLGQEHPNTLTGMANLASTYRNQGRWKEAEELLVRVMETRKRVLGPEHPDTLLGIVNLAWTYGNQGRLEEAEELEVEAVETLKRAIGQEHPDTLTGMATLALIYRNQGRWKEAEELEVQVLEIRERVLGQDHPDTLAGMVNLASTHMSQGGIDAAIALMEQVVFLRSRVLSEDHPDMKDSIHTLIKWRGEAEAST